MERCAALGVTNYGQFTAGGWFYIGSQGIVHGTYSTFLAAARQILHKSSEEVLRGNLLVSAGLGGMSGAQGKAIELCQGVGIIAEVDTSKIELRMRLGWIKTMVHTPQEAFVLAKEYQKKGEPISIGFHGNIVDLLEYAVETEQKIDLLTDQTSCHVAFDGGYCPQGLTFEERTKMLAENKDLFEEKVKKTLFRHHELIEILRSRGTYFFDYGNSLTTPCMTLGSRKCAEMEKMI